MVRSSVADGPTRDGDDADPEATATLTAGAVAALRQVADRTSPDAAVPEAGELPRGATVGRYVVLGVIATGGMGRVYQAVDPELDRRIALKLVGARRTDPTASARLLREAQALAQLSHPNVVTVYDAGRFGDDVYLAMELVEGTTLRAWMREARRPRAAVLDVLVSAGRGLAAAHRAGIVHRDFTPANVILGADGRVRVLDFGIARADTGPATPRSAAASPADSDPLLATDPGSSSGSGQHRSGESRLRSSDLTVAGARLGTPSYMAPEQHAGGDVDARADQFAFCVVLYEALRGKRPFAGRTLAELGENVRAGRTVEPIASLDAPGWLRGVIARGLAPRPENRFPSMEALLAELIRDRARLRRRLIAVAAVVSLTGTATAAGILIGGDAEDRSPCAGVGAELAGAWEPGVALRVRAALSSTGRAYALDTAQRVERILGDYAHGWIAARREACEATQIRGAQPAALMERRSDCLDRRRDKLAALTTAFASAPSDALVEDAIDLARGLPAIADCSDDEALLTTVPLPDDAAARARIAAVRERLDAIEARSLGVDVKQSLAEVQATLADARQTGHAPLVAEALYLRAALELVAGDPHASELTLYDAILAAAEAKDDLLTARAWTRLIKVIGNAEARNADALALRRIAEAALTRADAGALMRADFLDEIGNVLWGQASYADARALHQQAYDLRRARLSEDDPRLAISLQHLGGVAWSEGRLDEARALLERGLAITERSVGPDHPDVAVLHTNLGSIAMSQGDLAAADRHHRLALTITERAMGDDHVLVAACANNLADVARKLGHDDEARALLERAETIFVRALGETHPNVATTVQNLGELALAEHQPAQALAHFERALAGFEAAVGADHPFVAYPLTGIGLAHVAARKPAAAIAPLERALAIRQKHETPATDLATTRWALARALDASGRDRRRARALAEQARTAFAAAGAGFASERAEIDAWRARRGR